MQSRDGSSGFTILEALIALVIIAVAASLALPRISKPSDTATLRMAALGLAAELRTTRADAMRTSTRRDVIVDAVRKGYGSKAGRLKRLPRHLVVKVSGGAQASDGGLASFEFRPDGSSNGGRVTLRANRLRATVSVDWMTGATQISAVTARR